MMANPYPERPTFGLATNGDSSMFINLVKEPVALYDLSTDFSIFARPQNDRISSQLYAEVLKAASE